MLLWEDGSPLAGHIPSRRRHVLRNLALFVCVVAVADGLMGAWLLINPVSMAQHANIAYPACVERSLRWLPVTPAMHRVHHLPDPSRTNASYGQCFSVWDRLFGSYIAPEPRIPPRFGLANLAGEPFQSITGMC